MEDNDAGGFRESMRQGALEGERKAAAKAADRAARAQRELERARERAARGDERAEKELRKADARAAREVSEAEKAAEKVKAQEAKNAADRTKDAAKTEQRAAAYTARAEDQFRQTPLGRARTARESGQRFFQVLLPVENVDRTWFAKMTHEMDTRVQDTGDLVGALLTSIEGEGWELVEAGFTFRQTGQASRDKFMASGQQIAVMGETVGVYLFKAR